MIPPSIGPANEMTTGRTTTASVDSSRRHFLLASAGGAATLLAGCLSNKGPTNPLGNPLVNATLENTPFAPTKTITPGLYDMNPMGARAQLYVPPSYQATVPTPLIVLLHGAGRDSSEWMTASLRPLYDTKGALILAPESTDASWDLMYRGFGPDVKMLDGALKAVYTYCNVDPQRMTLGGFSDGASYALSLGEPNGTLFSRLIAFSPGILAAPGKRGSPRIYVAHGTQDLVLPINEASRKIVPALRSQGYTVTYNEFEGGHAIYLDVVTQAFNWLTDVLTV